VATLVLLWASGVFGPAGMALLMLTPFPAAYVHMRLGGWAGFGVVSLVSGVLWLTDGPLGIVLYIFQFGLASCLLPLLLRRGVAWDRALAGGALTTALAAWLALFGYAWRAGRPLGELVRGYVQSELGKVHEIYRQADLTPAQLDELKDLTARTGDFLVQTYPALLTVFSGVLLLFVMFLLARFARGDYLLPGAPLARWKAPESLIWLLILGGFGVFFAGGLAYQVALNLLTVILPVYFLQGIAVVSHVFQSRGVAPVLRVLGYMMLVIVNPLPAIITGVGIFDLWLDFRNPKVKKT